MLDFNLSNCPHPYTAALAQEEEADLLASICLAAASLACLILSQPALADKCSQARAELKQKLAELVS